MTNVSIQDAISALQHHVNHPEQGLPLDLFHYITTVTAIVNVDLLVQDEKGRTLLSWRDDEYCGKGWHIPGGIIRFKETLETRLKKVSELELGTDVAYDAVPIAMHEIIVPEQPIRGHFISFLYQCRLSSTFEPQNGDKTEHTVGYVKWHDTSPCDLLAVHEIYRPFILKRHLKKH